MNHKAIYALYPNTVAVDDGAGAFDKNGNLIEIDENLVNSWIDPDLYRQKRAVEYPSIVDQLDLLYHGGFDAWKSVIQEIKEKYPKPDNVRPSE